MKHKKKLDKRESDIVFSKTVKAGKRIYYFDVKKNKKGELFLSITESIRTVSENQTQAIQFEKHKIFLFKEDFDKFLNSLTNTLNYIKENNIVDFIPHDNEDDETIVENCRIIDNEIKLNIDF